MNVRCLGLGLIGSCFRKLFLRTFFGNTKNTKKSSLKTLLCILNLVVFYVFHNKTQVETKYAFMFSLFLRTKNSFL